VLKPGELPALQNAVNNVRFEPRLADYLMDIVEATRSTVRLSVGVSTRGALALQRACRAAALVEGRGHVLPDDVKAMVVPVLSHRVSLGSGETVVGSSRRAAEALLQEIISHIEVPL
jgi:MoxR-like ATPase